MASPVAAQLQPYFSYLLMGQLVLFGSTILVACLLFLRRRLRGEAPPDLGTDAARVAEEIHEEIKRLRALRDRLSPQFASEAPDALGAAPAAPSSEPGIAAEPSAAAPAVAGASVDRAAIEAEIEAKWSAKVAELEARAAASEGALKSAASGAAPAPTAEGGADASALKAECDELQKKISGLEKILSEYQIFEEDFALVKKYKEENEKLRAQLAQGGVADALGPKFTETDIASLFGDIAGDAAKAAAATETVAAPAPEPDPAPAEAAAEESDPELERMLAEAQKDVSTEETITGAPAQPEPAPVKIAGAPESAAAPADVNPAEDKAETLEAALGLKSVAEEDAEALSEADDDEVMAEFEKLLGEPNKPT